MKRVAHTHALIQVNLYPVSTHLMKYQIYKNLDCGGHLFFIFQFYRNTFALSDNGHSIRTDDF